jgi:predicted nuclease of predicted toxin-antitoxin system
VKLLLDEMISPCVARQLCEKGDDVQAIKHDRPELASHADGEIVRRMAAEQRAIVTNDFTDFQIIHDRTLAAGDQHAGMIFTFDDAMPRNKASIPQWVDDLAALLDDHRDGESLRNRILHLL